MAIPEGYEKLAVIGIVYKKEYQPETEYKYLNAVYYEGSTYVALKDNPGGPPSDDGVNWMYMAKGFSGESEKEVVFSARNEFPPVGKAEVLYVDNTVEPRIIYSWDKTKNSYVVTGGSKADPQIIEGAAGIFPGTGEEGKLYVDTEADLIYRWDKDKQKYVPIGGHENIIFAEKTSFPDEGEKDVIYVDVSAHESLSMYRWDGEKYITVPSGSGSSGGIGDTSIIAGEDDAFSEEKDYAAGDYCIHDNKLYVFTEQHEQGPWTGEDVCETTILHEIQDLNSKIKKLHPDYYCLISTTAASANSAKIRINNVSTGAVTDLSVGTNTDYTDEYITISYVSGKWKLVFLRGCYVDDIYTESGKEISWSFSATVTYTVKSSKE